MAKEDVRQAIRNSMFGKNEAGVSHTIEKDVCEHCGNIIEIDPHEEYIPEHGGTDVYRVTWCNKSCKEMWLEDSL